LSPLLRTVDAVLSQQVLITGRVTDDISGRPPRLSLSLTLVYRATPERVFPLDLRVTPDGQFAYFGNPRTTLPELTGGQSLALRLLASAPGYQTTSLDLTLSAADLTLGTETLGEPIRQHVGRDLEVELRTQLPISRNLTLQPEPVHLAGRIVQRNDPSLPVEGAEVRVTAPQARGPVTSAASGFYTLQDLPLVAEVEVRVTAAGFTTVDETITLDYAVALNQRSFALESE
jgi:hypothetical protein